MALRADISRRPEENGREKAMESHMSTLFHLLMALLPFAG